jgi:hypothetical protein
MTEYVVVGEDGTEYQTYDDKGDAKGRASRMTRSIVRDGSYHVEERSSETKFAIVNVETGDVQEAIDNDSVYDDEEKAHYFASVRNSRDLFNDYEVVEINPELFEGDESESEATDEDPEIEPVLFSDDETESAETDDDEDNTTMYDFMQNGDGNDEEQTATEDDEESYEVRMWSLGNHSTLDEGRSESMSNTLEQFMSDMDSDVDGEVMGVLQDAQSMIGGGSSSVRSFECPVDECGLQHSHSDDKHDIRSAFNVEPDFADGLLFNPYCHCSVNELAMLMRFFSYITEPVFTDQEQFEGVFEVDPDLLEEVYRSYSELPSVEAAVRQVAKERGLRQAQVAPRDVYDDLRAFFRRRQDIQNAANGAPIPQETRSRINDAEERLEEATSQ